MMEGQEATECHSILLIVHTQLRFSQWLRQNRRQLLLFCKTTRFTRFTAGFSKQAARAEGNKWVGGASWALFSTYIPITVVCGAVMAACGDKDVNARMNSQALAAFSPCGNLAGNRRSECG